MYLGEGDGCFEYLEEDDTRGCVENLGEDDTRGCVENLKDNYFTRGVEWRTMLCALKRRIISALTRSSYENYDNFEENSCHYEPF